jgi:hypothetical protein
VVAITVITALQLAEWVVVAMTNWQFGPYFSAPNFLAPNRDMRVGTEEREQAAQLLAQHLSAGRLELAEFEERVSAVYAARTTAQLAAPFRDLPGPWPAMPYRAGLGQFAGWRLPRRMLLLMLVVFGLALVVADVAFPPLFVIPIVLLLIHRRRRYAYGQRKQ